MPNRLADETSPYLLQHQDNPVNWYPWCEEALALARNEDRPIFLSIGYSACHWCHVMERESFESPKIAQLLNENFVSIKVDREERPDLDHIYMNAVMALQQQGGWPLNVFLTPQQEVFYGGTYWPPESRIGMPGFDQVLHGVLDAFLNRRDQVDGQSRQITAWLNQSESENDDLRLERGILDTALRSLHKNFDFEHGGFGGSPKFPHAMDLLFLIQMASNKDSSLPIDGAILLDMVRLTLKKMAYGGIFDHLGGGFARYSVDGYWLVPHFEKMLYDNALLVQAYLQMFRATADPFYSMIATKTLNYLLRDMLDESGGIHSTEDADSEGEEGKYYVWSRGEILQLLGSEAGPRFCELYNVTESGNFEGHNILNMQVSYQEFADSVGVDKETLRNEMRAARATLLDARSKRIRPGKDDKILASWNALAVSAFAQAAVLMDEEKYLRAAQRIADFVLDEMRDERGRLMHTWRQGRAKVDGFLDDYAGMLVGLVDLYSVDFDARWLSKAGEIANQMIQYFGDDAGGFYFTASDSEKLIARTKSFQDSSVPSGNAMAALGLLRLGRLVGSTRFEEIAAATIKASASLLERSALAAAQMLSALDEQLDQSVQLILFAKERSEAQRIGRSIAQAGRKAVSVLYLDPTQPIPEILRDISLGKDMLDEKPTLYVCQGRSCSQPVVGSSAIEVMVDQVLSGNCTGSLN